QRTSFHPMICHPYKLSEKQIPVPDSPHGNRFLLTTFHSVNHLCHVYVVDNLKSFLDLYKLRPPINFQQNQQCPAKYHELIVCLNTSHDSQYCFHSPAQLLSQVILTNSHNI